MTLPAGFGELVEALRRATVLVLGERGSAGSGLIISEGGAIVILEELRRTIRQSQAARALLDATIVRLSLAEQFTPIAQMIGQDVPVTAEPAAKKKS